ncbi:MAG: SAM-dependent methyltransferase [Bacteroidetes bacterium]|nr:SAM-dependent methyltransferase [Bacteroidota bacterium]
MNHLSIIKAYIKFLFKAQSRYKIHSPFVYKYLAKVITNKKNDDKLKVINKLRSELRNDNEILQIEDLGAGTRDQHAMKIQRRVSEIAKRTSVPKPFAKMLFRTVHHFKPRNILEFGTSLGISSVLFSFANENAEVHTMEGSPEILKRAKSSFAKLGRDNIHTKCGNFDNILEAKLKELKQLDFVFFDGNHAKEPTIKYFEECLKYHHEESIFVFDDIHWSEGMTEAWEYIKQHPASKVTIDFFFMGVVFFKKDLSKQDFIYRL